MGDVDDDIIVLQSLVSLETASVDGLFMPFIKNVVDTLKPCIRQIPGLNELNLHASPPVFSRCEIEK